MQIALAVLIAAVLGVALHFALPHRPTRGAVVAPAVAAAAGAVVWTVSTWAGLGIADPWIWVASVVVPVVVALPVVLAISGVRARGDERERARLGVV